MILSPLTWLALGIILMAVEIVAPGFIVFWFGLGASLTALMAWTGLIYSPSGQWFFFFVSSLAFLGLWFGWLKKKLGVSGGEDQRDPTLFDLRGRCTSGIEPSKPGQVELYESYHGLRVWQAESEETIPAGEEIQVLEARGIKLKVKTIGR